MNLKDYVASIKDYPTKGIIFRDITPAMLNGKAYKAICDEVVVGPEARGFIFGCPVAYALGVGFAPVRKPYKLPRETVDVEYDLEYGTDTLSMHVDALKKGQKVLIVDDLLATGGTVEATIKLVEKLGAIVVGAAFFIELEELKGIEKVKGIPTYITLKY